MFHSALFGTIMRCRCVKSIIVLMWLLPAGFLQAASVPTLNARQNEILHIAMVANGYVTPALHREFWSMFPDDVRNDPTFLAYLERKLAALYRYHREVIVSARSSITYRMIVWSPGYAAAKAELEFDQEASILPGRTVIDGEALIRAAAGNGVGVDPMVFDNVQKIDDLDGALDGSLARMKILLRPDWRALPREYFYADANVAIVSVVPFTRRSRFFSWARMPFASVRIVSQQLDEERFVAVARVMFATPPHNTRNDKSAALIAVIEQMLSHYDAAVGEPPRVENRHGYLSVETAVYVISPDANSLVLARAIYRKRGEIIVLLSRSGQATARANFEAFERAIRFLGDEKSR